MNQPDITMKAMKAVLLYDEGWSINVSMCKAGFTSTWNGQEGVKDHPIVKALKALNKDNMRRKNRSGHRLSFSDVL